MRVFPVINSGTSASSAFYIRRAAAFFTLHAASAAASDVRLAFSSTSGTGPWAPLCRDDGTGAPFSAVSGSQGWAVFRAPSPFFRVEQTANTTDTRTFVVMAVLG